MSFIFNVVLSSLLLGSIICGPQIVPRVSHGTKAKAKNYPSQVLIITGEDPGRVCGGAIISSEWVMTAAHCVRTNEDGTPHDPMSYELRFGVQNRFKSEKTQVIRKIAEIVRNPAYESQNHSNDIALIKMKEPIDFKKHPNLKPMCLDLTGIPIQNKQCFLTGFGRVDDDFFEPLPAELQQLQMKPFDHNKCADIHRRFYEHTASKEKVTAKQFCMVSTAKPNKGDLSKGGGCAGDSGGPLQCKVNNIWYQFGIAWSATDCERNPTVFQHVHKYAQFIKNATNYELPAYCTENNIFQTRIW